MSATDAWCKRELSAKIREDCDDTGKPSGRLVSSVCGFVAVFIMFGIRGSCRELASEFMSFGMRVVMVSLFGVSCSVMVNL